MEQAKRNAIAELRSAGHTPAYIAKALKYPRTVVMTYAINMKGLAMSLGLLTSQ